jgi:hypothetical protein
MDFAVSFAGCAAFAFDVVCTSLNPRDDVDDEGGQQDEQTELLRAGHRGGVSL